MTVATPSAPVSVHERLQQPFSSWPSTGSPAGFVRAPLGEAETAFFRENGFLVIEDFYSSQEIAALNAEAVRICRGDAGPVKGLLEHRGDETDDEILRKYLCIHFPHKLSELMQSTITNQRTADALTRIIGPNVKCMQSMLFIKASGKPGQAWHQDEYYIPTRDRSLTGGWIAFDDATVENGCLWVLPGSHRHGILWPQHQQTDRRFDCAGESGGFPYRDEDAVPVEMKKGSIVFFNGYLLHRSLPNRAAGGYRRSLVNHFMSAESLLPWHNDESGWQGQCDSRDIIMVAGVDPYAYKGIENRHGAHVRPSGEGGCGDSKNNQKAKD